MGGCCGLEQKGMILLLLASVQAWENVCEEVMGNCLYTSTCDLLADHGFVPLHGIPCDEAEHCGEHQACVCCFNAEWSSDDKETSSSDPTSDAIHRCWAQGGHCVAREECEVLPGHSVDEETPCLKCHHMVKHANPLTKSGEYPPECVCCVADPTPAPTAGPAPPRTSDDSDCNITDTIEIIQKSTCTLTRTDKGLFELGTETVLPHQNLAVINNFDSYASDNIFERGSCDNRVDVPIPDDDDDYLALFNETLAHDTNGWNKTLGEYESTLWPEKTFLSVAFSREFTLPELFEDCVDYLGAPLPGFVESENPDNFFYDGSLFTSVVSPEADLSLREDFVFFQKECAFHITVSGRKGQVTITYLSILVDFNLEWKKTVCDDKHQPFYVLTSCVTEGFALKAPVIVSSGANSSFLIEGYASDLTAAQMVPPTNSLGTADITLFVNEEGLACFWLSWTDLVPSLLNFYSGAEGVNGNLLHSLMLPQDETSYDLCFDGNFTELLRTGLLYATLDDEIRGQLELVHPPCQYEPAECCQHWLLYNADDGPIEESLQIDWEVKETSEGSVTAFVDFEVPVAPCFELLEAEHNFSVSCDLFHDEAFQLPYLPDQDDFFLLCNQVYVNCSIDSLGRDEYCDFFDLDITRVAVCERSMVNASLCDGEEVVLLVTDTFPNNPPFDFEFIEYEDCCMEERFRWFAKSLPPLFAGRDVLVIIDYCINSKTNSPHKRTISAGQFLFSRMEQTLALPHRAAICSQ